MCGSADFSPKRISSKHWIAVEQSSAKKELRPLSHEPPLSSSCARFFFLWLGKAGHASVNGPESARKMGLERVSKDSTTENSNSILRAQARPSSKALVARNGLLTFWSWTIYNSVSR